MDHRGLELARRLDGVVVVRRRHNSHLKAKELRDWLRKSANWNGVAIVYDPYERVNIPARYLGEIEFRWNRRGPFESRLATLFGTKSGPLPLKALFA